MRSRKWGVMALATLAMLCLMTPGAAWLGSKRIVELSDIIFGVEYVVQKPIATLFHSQKLAATDTEALAIAFPVDALGQTVSPSIAQTAENTATASDTGFFTANWCYTAQANPGGYALTPEINTWHPMKSASMVGSGISWPYMDNAPLYGASTMTFRPAINTSQYTGNASQQPPATGAGSGGLTGWNRSSGATAPEYGNATPGAARDSVRSTKPNRDYKNMTRGDIRNMTGLEKMYRNANLKNTVPQSYKGTVQRPTVIAPLEKPIDLIKPPDKPRVINDALNMTRTGTHLNTLFWDL